MADADTGGQALRHRHVHARADARGAEAIVALPLGAAPPRQERGHGILGMRERAELAGGRLEAGAGADETFRVAARFPMRRAA